MKDLEAREFVIGVVEHIIGEEAKPATKVPETLRTLTPVTQFKATMDKARRAFETSERASTSGQAEIQPVQGERSPATEKDLLPVIEEERAGNILSVYIDVGEYMPGWHK